MMATPGTHTKRLLTDDDYSAFHPPRSPYSNVISDDLTVRLQNLGSRVRRCVNEGYATQRYVSVPPTPYPSPVKPTTSCSSGASPGGIAYFRSANDTLNDVFLSSSRSAVPATPSPKKRVRAEVDHEDETPVTGSDEDIAMESDEESVCIITNNSNSRPIKPLRLRKTSSRYIPATTLQSSDSGIMFVDKVSSERNHAYEDLFNQPF